MFCSQPVFTGSTAFAKEYQDQDEILSDLNSGWQPNDLELNCSAELYNILSADDFRELYRLLIKAGVGYTDVGISYNDRQNYIEISDLNYNGLPWAECRSDEDVMRAEERFAADKQDHILLCTDDLFSQLLENHHVNLYAAQNGIEDLSMMYNTGLGIFIIEDLYPFTVPYAVVNDYVEFSAVIDSFAESEIDEFYIVFKPELFNKILNNSYEMTIMTGSSRLSDYAAYADPGSCTYNFYRAEYTDIPREICLSANDVREAIERMGTIGISEFELLFPDTSLYDTLCENHFELLHQIEAEAGMVKSEMRYGSGRIIYSETEIEADVTALATLDDVIAYTGSQISADKHDIHLFCTAELYRSLLGDLTEFAVFHEGMNRIYDLTALFGINDYSISASEATHLITIHINAFFPGTAIIRAVRSGNTGSLSQRETAVRQAAEEIAAEAMKFDDPLERALFIHDWICTHTVYRDDESKDEDDTAIGSILNGEANCDGYSDAFYLIGTLAGLSIRYQHGDSLDKSALDQLASITHIWNLIEIDGSWRLIDVTWDDDEHGFTHVWFNAGMDFAERTHSWNRDMSVDLIPKTERTLPFSNEFYVHNEQEMQSVGRTAGERELSEFYVLFEDPSLVRSSQAVVDQVLDLASNSMLHYTWNDKIGLLGFYDVTW
ncbi:MAG: hypothetical protein IKP86_08270 [Anaerolineaceae bacterium]|nr:hypothetical protein [Anaerolineaceae bacterium]